MNTLVFRTTTRTVLRTHTPSLFCSAGPSRLHQATRYASKKAVEPPRRPRNDEIKYRVVRLVNPETSALEPPAPLENILASLASRNAADAAEVSAAEAAKDAKDAKAGKNKRSRNNYYVELVVSNPEPIVKIVSTRDVYKKQQAQREKKQEKPKSRDEKEIQLTWGVATADLQHKLDKARTELEKGNRVSLVYARKKGQTPLSPQEMEARAQEVVASLADAGVEWKARDVSPHTTIIYLQGHNLPISQRQRNLQRKEQLDS